MVTCPLVNPVIVTEHVHRERVHVVEARETEPVPVWDHVTVSPATEPT